MFFAAIIGLALLIAFLEGLFPDKKKQARAAQELAERIEWEAQYERLQAELRSKERLLYPEFSQDTPEAVPAPELPVSSAGFGWFLLIAAIVIAAMLAASPWRWSDEVFEL
jgi:hypothetical protein